MATDGAPLDFAMAEASGGDEDDEGDSTLAGQGSGITSTPDLNGQTRESDPTQMKAPTEELCACGKCQQMVSLLPEDELEVSCPRAPDAQPGPAREVFGPARGGQTFFLARPATARPRAGAGGLWGSSPRPTH